MNIYIHMIGITNIPTIINEFSNVFSNINNITEVDIVLDFTGCSFVNPECITIIVAFVKYIESLGILINMEVNNYCEDVDRYMSRIDFYKNVDIDSEEQFSRWNSEGRFLEITHFDADNAVIITNDTIKIIRDNCSINDSVLRCLNYCFFEIADNVDTHSCSPIDGYVLVQNYPRRRELKIVIVDTGVGIHESLTKTPGTEYDQLDPKESLEYCIKQEITNGNGMGNGLFHTSEFIKENKGEMIIYSGGNYLQINNGITNIFNGTYWQGTIIYLKIYTDNKVELQNIFGENLPETVENMEDYIDGEFSLW